MQRVLFAALLIACGGSDFRSATGTGGSGGGSGSSGGDMGQGGSVGAASGTGGKVGGSGTGGAQAGTGGAGGSVAGTSGMGGSSATGGAGMGGIGAMGGSAAGVSGSAGTGGDPVGGSGGDAGTGNTAGESGCPDPLGCVGWNFWVYEEPDCPVEDHPCNITYPKCPVDSTSVDPSVECYGDGCAAGPPDQFDDGYRCPMNETGESCVVRHICKYDSYCVSEERLCDE